MAATHELQPLFVVHLSILYKMPDFEKLKNEIEIKIIMPVLPIIFVFNI